MYMPPVPVSDKHDEYVPGLGDNNVEVLKSLGYSDQEISAFTRDGVI
jgi:crotonobetainyl-CoA:carnitine CoA-transferase CaiB-like acyl-CoA transferase